MRCRQGDLAVIVRSLFPAENLGRMVTIVRPGDGAYDWEVLSVGGPLRAVSTLTGLETSSRLIHMNDSQLRPIRDQEGVDESLRNLLLEL